MKTDDSLVDRLDATLPQTQCTRCGFPDCQAYARAMASGEAPINRCPPGGAEGILRLSVLTGAPAAPLDPAHGVEGPRALAIIDEQWCIGCTLCIKACPVDCIVGASKRMHTVMAEQCTGCELCVPACPVDCIAMRPVTGTRTGWDAWSPEQAASSRRQYDSRKARLQRDAHEQEQRLAERAAARLAELEQRDDVDAQALERKRAVVQAAIERARRLRPPPGHEGGG